MQTNCLVQGSRHIEDIGGTCRRNRMELTMIEKYKAVAVAALVAVLAVGVATAQASNSRHELESQYHGNTR